MTTSKTITFILVSIMLLVAVLCMATFGIMSQTHSVKAEALPGTPTKGWEFDDSLEPDLTYHYDLDSVFSYNIVYGDYNQDGLYDNVDDLSFIDSSNNISFLPSNLALIKNGNGVSHYVITFVFNCCNLNPLNLSGSLAWNGMYHLVTFGGNSNLYKNSIYLCYDNSNSEKSGYYLLTPSGCFKVAHCQADNTRFILQFLFNSKLSYSDYKFFFNIYNNNFRYQCTLNSQSVDSSIYGHALDLCVYHNSPSYTP